LPGITVAFDRYVPEPFRGEHERARAIAEDQVIRRLPKLGAGLMWAYVLTRVSVQARSHLEALERGLDALDRRDWNSSFYRGDDPLEARRVAAQRPRRKNRESMFSRYLQDF
jgi:hypothetical protein